MTVTIDGEKMEVEVCRYPNSAPALKILDGEGCPYAVATTNLEAPLNVGEVAIDDRKGKILSALVSEGIVSKPVRIVRQGWSSFYVCSLLFDVCGVPSE